MPAQRTLAESLSVLPIPELDSILKYLTSISPRIRLLLTCGGLLAFIVKYLSAKSAKRATGGGYYVEDLGKVRFSPGFALDLIFSLGGQHQRAQGRLEFV